MNTYIIVRKKNDPTAPLLTSTPESVDLDLFDVVDEHGNVVGQEELDEIRKLQAPPAPATAHGKTPVAPQHEPPKTTPHVPPAAHKKAQQ